MKIVSKCLPIRHGHFRWCSAPQRRDTGCDRCKAEAYAYAIVLNALVAFLEFWGSGRTASLSLESDAWHMTFDMFGYCIGLYGAISLIGSHYTEKQMESIKRRLEILMALFLIGTALIIASRVGGHLWRSDMPEIVESELLLSIATVGLLVNLMFLVFFWALKIQHACDEGGIRLPSHTHRHKDKILSGNFWHTFGDAVASGMVVGNGLVYQLTNDPSWFFLEFSVSLTIAGMLFWQGWKILFPKSDELP